MSLNARPACCLLLVFVAAACAPSNPPARRSSGNAGWRRGPISAELVGPKLAVGKQLVLVLNLRRSAPFDRGVAVRWHLPRGVRATDSRGNTQHELAPGVDTVQYTFDVDELPREPLAVTLDVRSRDFGYHATLHHDPAHMRRPWRSVRAAGPDVRIGGHNFGPSVELD
jgi:hypothetical protein